MEEIKKLAREYATTKVNGYVVWYQFDKNKYEAFIAGAKIMLKKLNNDV